MNHFFGNEQQLISQTLSTVHFKTMAKQEMHALDYQGIEHSVVEMPLFDLRMKKMRLTHLFTFVVTSIVRARGFHSRTALDMSQCVGVLVWHITQRLIHLIHSMA